MQRSYHGTFSKPVRLHQLSCIRIIDLYIIQNFADFLGRLPALLLKGTVSRDIALFLLKSYLNIYFLCSYLWFLDLNCCLVPLKVINNKAFSLHFYENVS
jgi:hypothetical protein